MKKIIAAFLLISMFLIMLSSCSFFDSGITMPTEKIDYTFENDKWLVIENHLINKIDGTVHRLEINYEIPIPGVYEFYSYSANVYKYEFEESTLKQYTFLEVYTGSGTSLYYEYVITYGYDGKEIGRACMGELLTKAEMQKEYDNRSLNIDDFEFHVLDSGAGYISGRFGSIDKENASGEKQIVLDFAEDLYKAQSGYPYHMDGIAKPIENKLWFSTAVSNRRDDLRGNPLISGISETTITSYDFETKEFKTIFEYNKKKAQIIDFDENGAYILDSKGRLSYVGFEMKEQTEIYRFSNIDLVVITDKYICVKYQLSGYTYFVYEKGGSVIANDSALY